MKTLLNSKQFNIISLTSASENCILKAETLCPQSERPFGYEHDDYNLKLYLRS